MAAARRGSSSPSIATGEGARHLPGGLDPAGLGAWRALLTAHAAAVGRIERDLAAAGDLLPLTWYDVLLELNAAPGRRLRQRDLAREVVLTRSGISRLVDRLAAAGLLRREPNPADRRGDLVALSAAGRVALQRTWPAYARGIQEHFARHLSRDEADVVEAALTRVRAGAAAAGAAAGETPAGAAAGAAQTARAGPAGESAAEGQPGSPAGGLRR